MADGEGTAAIQTLVTAIDAQNDEATEAVVALLNVTDEPALIRLLHAQSAEYRWWAIRALGAWGGETSLDALLPFLTNERTDLRSVALMALGKIAERHPSTLQPLLPQLAMRLADPDGLIRQVAADTLAQLGNAAIPPLVALLRTSDDQGARSRAAYALGKIGTIEAAAPLYYCLNDKNYLVHTYAYEALDKLGLLENRLIIF